ncbi:carboxypeptidase-like regulatory domain-containing protein [Micromonospora globbae]|uniref:Carboxypeptidase regulatory-like domain-containing protein n=1 Tax=Micromonospora globbae TaxID=1894969 RepID=A0A420F3W7_9ACTN|nr:carboxypeptidase-like regulatory domain-containing protein [Micromonospora globbae]RKF27606.1 carboxypeptidase regulatory-like domain-containing protein [Micromonospora globbae]
MSTHRRAWKQRAGVVVALVAGALLALPATPALAAEVSVNPTSVSLNAGSDTTVTVRVSPGNGDKNGEISLTGLPPGVTCSSGCGRLNLEGLPGQSKTQLLTLSANDNAADANTTVTVRVVPDQSDPATGNFSLTVKGKAAPSPTQAQTVRSVSGKVVVKDSGDPVPNAFVILQDSGGHRYDTTTDGSGNWRFTGSSSKPITPGRIDVGASFDDVREIASFNASAGQAITGKRISLPIKVEKTPSPTPSASVEPTEEPSEEPTEEVTGEAEEATDAPAANASNEDSGGGFGSILIILLGGLLVAAGVGTIVLLWMKRKENPDDAGDDAPVAAGAAGAVPAARGAFRGADDQTRVVNRAGVGPDPTMVGGTALSDAPTMMHRPVVDDVPPDPYGVPPTQPYGGGAGGAGWSGGGYGDEPNGYGAGGYGGAPSSGGGYGAGGDGYGGAPGAGGGYGGPAGGYGNAPSSGGGYGNTPSSDGGYGTAPSSGSGYGSRDYGGPAGAAGYPPASDGPGYGERYDEPTGRYTGESTQYPAPADPYATGLYEQDQGQGYGHAEPAPYGRDAEPTGGYDRRGGYDDRGGYDQGGYGQPGAYGQEPPTQRGGYGQEPPTQRGGYDDRGGYDQGGYGQPGAYGQEPPTQRGGYDDRGGYDQGGYYGDQGGRGRDGAAHQDRGGRRLDWLDD